MNNIGKIFKYNKSFWKVTGEPFKDISVTEMMYPVIACSRTGKDEYFHSKSRFGVTFIDNAIDIRTIKNTKIHITINKFKIKLYEYLKKKLIKLENEIDWCNW